MSKHLHTAGCKRAVRLVREGWHTGRSSLQNGAERLFLSPSEVVAAPGCSPGWGVPQVHQVPGPCWALGQDAQHDRQEGSQTEINGLNHWAGKEPPGAEMEGNSRGLFRLARGGGEGWG